LFPFDSCLLQLLIPQALNSSLLAPPQARWAPLSILPNIFMLLFFMINPPMISISFSWVIINFIYFYVPTVTRVYTSNSFMCGSAIDSILPILSIFVTAFRTIVQRGELQTFIPAVPEERTSPMHTLLLPLMLLSFSPCALLLQTFASPPRTFVSGSVLSLADAATC
jgi:hypothetical protein